MIRRHKKMILFGMKRGLCTLAAAAILGLQVFGSGGKEEETIPITISNAASIIGSLETKKPGTYTIVIEGESNNSHRDDFDGITENLRALPEGYFIHLDLAQVRTRWIDFSQLNNIECLVTLILPTTLELLNYPEGPNLSNSPGFVEGCKNLSNIFIPAGFPDTYRNVEFLLRGINTCPNLKFTVASANQVFSTDKTGSMLLSKDGATLYCWPSAAGSTTLPKTITKISQYAFEDNTSITKVKIHKEVTEIGYYAFSGCTSLTSVSIPDSVTGIGPEAFSGCTGLTRIEFEDTSNWYLLEIDEILTNDPYGKQINVNNDQINAGNLTSETGTWVEGILAKNRTGSWEDWY